MVNEIQPAQDVNKEINQNTTQEPHMHILLTVSEWQQLHNQVYQMMTNWANQQKLNHLA